MFDHVTAILLAGFLTCNTADTLTSRLAFGAGAAEKNPAMQGWTFPVLKGASAGAATALTITQGKRHQKFVRTVLVAGAAFYAGIAAHNYSVYREQQRINR